MKGMPTLDLEAAADAIVDRTDRAARGVQDVLDQAGETTRAAMAEATSILDRIQASAGHLGEILRSAGASAEMAGNKARASAETARSKAEEAASIGDRAIRTTAAMGQAARQAAEDAGVTIDRARQVVGDAIGGSAAERVRGPRTSRRMRAGLLVAGVAGGAATTYFLDADRGADRRKVAIDHLRRWSHRASEAIATTAHTVRLRIEPLLTTTSAARAGSTAGRRSSAKVAATRSSLPTAPTAPARP